MLTLACALLFAATPAEPPVDLEKTAAYLAEWTSRDNFPDTATFAYYSAYCYRALRRPMPAAAAAKAVGFLKRSQAASGGFASQPKWDPKPSLLWTAHALKALALLGKLGAVDAAKAAAFVRAQAMPDGGFRMEAGEKESSLAATHFALESLAILGRIQTVDRARTRAFIERFAAEGGGFSMTLPPRGSLPRATYFGIAALSRLGAIKPAIKSGAVAYLKSTPYSGLVTAQPPPYPETEELAYALAALRLLGALEEIRLPPVEGFLAARFVPENGGFGPQDGYGSTPPSTYAALEAMVSLGRLPDPFSAK